MIPIALIAIATKRLGLERIKAAARVTAYATCVTAVIGLVGVQKARASINETGLLVGQDLIGVAPLLQDGSTFNVNGQRVHFATAHSMDGKSAILDKFQASCEAAEGGDAAVWSHIPDTSEEVNALHADKLSKMPVLRQEAGRRGFVACLVSTEASTPESLRKAAADFLKNRQKLELGRLRYATVEENATGSTVMTVWTDENFDIGALMPDPARDKPGFDPLVMQRPPNVVRVLSGAVESLPYKVFLYESKQSPTDAMDAYDRQMFAAGWVSIQPPQAMGVPHEGFEAHAYMRNGFIGYMTASKSPQGGTLVGVGETAGQPLDKEHNTRSDADGF